eukprot:g517.t1
MQRLASFDSQNIGIALYSNGQIAVNVIPTDGGQRMHFFHNNAAHSSLAMWTIPQGVGFINFPSGKPRLVVGKRGGRHMAENGNLIEEWRWNCRGRYTGPAKGIEFSINSSLFFSLAGPEDVVLGAARMTITYRNIDKVFNVGRQPFKTAGHKRPTKLVNGVEVRSTLIDRVTSIQKKSEDPFRDIHARNLSYPKLSASGREVLRVPLSKKLQAVEKNWKVLHDRVDTEEFSSSITKKKAFHASLRGANALQATIRAVGKKTKRNLTAMVPLAKQPPRFKLTPLEAVNDKAFFAFVRDWCSRPENTKRVLVAFVTNRLTSDARTMERMLMRVMHKWRMEAKQLSKNNRAKAKIGDDATTKAMNSSAATTAAAIASANRRMPPEDSSLSKASICLCDSSHSSTVAKRLGFQVYPMILMYFRGKLMFAENTFSSCRKTEEAFYETLDEVYRKALSGLSLGKDFCFESRFFSGSKRNHRGITEQHHAVWSTLQQ